MYDVRNIVSNYMAIGKLTMMGHEELDLLMSENNVEYVEVKIIPLESFNVTKDRVLNKIYLEFIFYIIFIDEIVPETKELYIEHIGECGVYSDLIGHYDMVPETINKITKYLEKYGRTLLFLGWSDTKINKESLDGAFISGYRDEVNND